jgi:hypothetical protein
MSPIMTVADPMRTSEKTNIFLRPIRSPKWPKTIAPAGREKKATPKVANAARVPDNGLSDGKNATPNTRAAAVPKMKKSYHSIAVPTKLAKATFAGFVRPTCVSSVIITSNAPIDSLYVLRFVGLRLASICGLLRCPGCDLCFGSPMLCCAPHL